MVKPRRKGIEKIESTTARNVCFSKRRKGLFKKADELRRLDPNIYVSAIVFSPAGKPFVYGETHRFSSRPPRHHTDEFNDILSVDISSLNRTELESHARDLKRLRSILLLSEGGNESRDTNGVSFSRSGIGSEFLNFASGSENFGDELGYDFESNINNGSVSLFESGVISDIVGGEDHGVFPELGIGFGPNVDDYNISELFKTNVDRNIGSVSFSGSEVNSVGFNSCSIIDGENHGLMSGLGVNFGFSIEDFPVSELGSSQVMDCDDFMSLSDLGFNFELEKDNVVGFGADFEPGMGIEPEDEEIEAVLRDFINDANEDNNCINNVF